MNHDVNTDGFAKAIEREIAAIEAERQREREAKILEEEKRDQACRTALRVRDEVILPLLSAIHDAFAKAKILQRWEVQSEGKMDCFSATCRSCSVNPEDLTFRIKADVAVQEQGGMLRFAVACECVGATQPPANPILDLHKSDDCTVDATQADMAGIRRWYFHELEACVVACVREKRKLMA
jgi:hypothetical protein